MSRRMSTQYPTTTRARSQDGIRYTAAMGATMPNRGDNDVTFFISGVHRCVLQMQVTDVQHPLRSMS